MSRIYIQNLKLPLHSFPLSEISPQFPAFVATSNSGSQASKTEVFFWSFLLEDCPQVKSHKNGKLTQSWSLLLIPQFLFDFGHLLKCLQANYFIFCPRVLVIWEPLHYYWSEPISQALFFSYYIWFNLFLSLKKKLACFKESIFTLDLYFIDR